MNATQIPSPNDRTPSCWYAGIRRARIVAGNALLGIGLLSFIVFIFSILSMFLPVMVTAALPIHDKFSLADGPVPELETPELTAPELTAPELTALTPPAFVVAEKLTVLVHYWDWGDLYSIIRADVAAHGGYERNDRGRAGYQFVVPADYLTRLKELAGADDRTRYRRWARTVLAGETTPPHTQLTSYTQATPDTEITIIRDQFIFHRIWLKDTVHWAGIAAAAGVLLFPVCTLLSGMLYVPPVHRTHHSRP